MRLLKNVRRLGECKLSGFLGKVMRSKYEGFAIRRTHLFERS